MGNICSKSANKSDNFTGPGRVLGAANEGQPAPTSTPVPQQVVTNKTNNNSPGRSLGASHDGATPSSPDDVRGAAAKAAEARATAGAKIGGGGKLSANLAAQKKQTQNQLLSAASEQERRAREADSTAESQAHN